MSDICYIGNIDLLKQQKVAFLSSRNISPQSVIACYDWATQQRSTGRCVISGFHSQIEKDVLHFLLKGKQPLILVLGRSLYKQLPEEFIKPLEENRLLIVSVVSQRTNRQSIETALLRNKYIVENANEVVFGSLDPNGMLYQLFTEIKSLNKHTIL
jgi:predicted Rossmann fold nucleotide-binding protein DprA/Smf involved in DNA uptake